MADVKWIKIVTDIFDDEKILLIESLPDSDGIIVIWFKLLCLAGKNNNSGVFILNEKIPYTDEMFATIFRRPINTVRLALKTFQDFGMVEIVNGAVTIPNWGKHQTLDQLENKREYMRGYMQDYREKQKQLADGKTKRKTNNKANVSEANKTRAEKIRQEQKEEKEIQRNPAWAAFVEMRKKIKKPLSDRAISMALSDLEKLAPGDLEKQAAILDQSTFHCWQGLFEIKQNTNYHQNGQESSGNIFFDILREEGKM